MEKFPLRLTLNKLTLVITGRNEVAAKVMFLLVSVILFTGGLPQCMLGYHHPPPGRRPPFPAEGSTPRHTVNERPVRILLECILVFGNVNTE